MSSKNINNLNQSSLPSYKINILDEDLNKFDISYKIIVIGDSGVGKSCLTMKATRNIFEENSIATIGFEFYSFIIEIENKIMKMQIWDTCGQEIYRSLITNFYRNSALAIIVYSIDSVKSFENSCLWLKELKNYSSPDIKVILIGNKCDLESNRKVTYQEGLDLSIKFDLDLFLETSAKTGLNAKEVFLNAGKILYSFYLKNNSNKSSDKDKSNSNNDSHEFNKEGRIKLPSNTFNNFSNTSQPNKSEEKCCK